MFTLVLILAYSISVAMAYSAATDGPIPMGAKS